MQSLETKSSRPSPKSFETETRPETFEIETRPETFETETWKNGSRDWDQVSRLHHCHIVSIYQINFSFFMSSINGRYILLVRQYSFLWNISKVAHQFSESQFLNQQFLNFLSETSSGCYTGRLV